MSSTGSYNWTKWDTEAVGGGEVSRAVCSAVREL